MDFRNKDVDPSDMKGGKDVLNTHSLSAANTTALTSIGISNCEIHSVNRESRFSGVSWSFRHDNNNA
jgi:hypothetical protein